LAVEATEETKGLVRGKEDPVRYLDQSYQLVVVAPQMHCMQGRLVDQALVEKIVVRVPLQPAHPDRVIMAVLLAHGLVVAGVVREALVGTEYLMFALVMAGLGWCPQ
jgi:hypothetical protein